MPPGTPILTKLPLLVEISGKKTLISTGCDNAGTSYALLLRFVGWVSQVWRYRIACSTQV